jgi:hypothetical protein
MPHQVAIVDTEATASSTGNLLKIIGGGGYTKPLILM